MADFTIDANGPGSYGENVGYNGTDDRVTVNIGPSFSGTINVTSAATDNENDFARINLPDGRRLQQQLSTPLGDEDPTHNIW